MPERAETSQLHLTLPQKSPQSLLKANTLSPKGAPKQK